MTAVQRHDLPVAEPDDDARAARRDSWHQSTRARLFTPGRLVAWAMVTAVVVGGPALLQQFHARRWSLAVIYAIVALSLNVLIGHAGQISLGHQGFLGVGAFVAAYTVTAQGQTFWVGLVAGAVSGALTSLVLGAISLRVKGLYFALVTLAYGRVAQEAVFNLDLFGAGAGIEATRAETVSTERSFYYLCLVCLVVVLYLDYRFTTTKAGRAVNAQRENTQVAASLGINVDAYRLYAFALSGVFVGLAGALFAFRNNRVVGNDFDFTLALFLVIVTVVGGLRSRWGVVVWTVFFTLLPEYSADYLDGAPQLSRFFGAVLLIVILAFRPGGIGQLIRPITDWLAGQPWDPRRRDEYVAGGVSARP